MRLLIEISVIFALVLGGGISFAEEPQPGAAAGTAPVIAESELERDPFSSWLPQPVVSEQQRPEQERVTDVSAPEAVITPPQLTIQGVIWNTDLPQAIVNNTVVRIGDTVSDAQIVGVTQEGIEIVYQGKQFSVKKDVPASTAQRYP